jgi:hypothetical protein
VISLLPFEQLLKPEFMRAIAIIALLAVLAGPCLSQSPPEVDDLLLDFSVPDMPAFKALGSDPSNILRPSDIQKFGVMMSAFRSEGSTVIPKSFSLEVAPWKLAGNDWTIYKYRSKVLNRILYNSSISLGTVGGDEDNIARNVSVGLRTTLISKKADIIRSEVVDKIYNEQRGVLRDRNNVKEQWAKDRQYDPALLTDEQEAEFDEFWAKYSIETSTFTNTAEYVSEFNANNWNGSRLDLAIAWVGASPDSLVKNVHSENFLVWATAAIKPGKNNNHGQLLIGVNYQRPRTITGETDPNSRFTGNIRYYEGNKNFRGFLEFQYSSEKQTEIQKGLLNLGAELRVRNEFWIMFSAGVDDIFQEGSGSAFVSSVDIRYSYNKK